MVLGFIFLRMFYSIKACELNLMPYNIVSNIINCVIFLQDKCKAVR